MTLRVEDMARLSFEYFAQQVFPLLEPGTRFEYNWHVGCIADYLQALNNGEIRRLIINLPPRSLKSFLISKAFPAWVLGNNPAEKFINTSYGYEIAEANSMGCKSIMKTPWYKQLFPNTRIGALDRATHFETTQHGQYYAATALSPITGLGCGILEVDDPLRPMEAVSDQLRKNTNDNIRGTLFSRLNDKRTGRIVIVMQRVHEDDPTGNLMKDDGWTLLKLPAENKTGKTIHVGLSRKWEMKPNELLFPARLSREILDQDMVDMTMYNYYGQMLQEPVPIGGGEFKDSWVQYYANGGIKPKTMNICILCDASAGNDANKKKKKNSDFTSFAVVGLAPDNNYYLLDLIRDRFNPTERIDTLFTLHKKWNALSGKPPRVGYEEYGLMSDIHYIKLKSKEEGYNFQVIKLQGRMSKETRIRRIIPDMERGRWYFPESIIYVDTEGRRWDLVHELIYSELMNFPVARNDDCVDSISRVMDDDMMMNFPRQKKSEKDKMIASAMEGEKAQDDSWLNF